MKKSPLFTAAMALCAVLALGELYLIYERFMASREAAKTLVARKGELQGMADLNPPPKREVATAIEADLAKAQAALTAMQAELKGRGPAAERLRSAKVPANRTDAFFDLASFVEKTRELAKKNDVLLRPEASRFGFTAYATEGPAADHIEPVFRQRQISQYLMEALMEAKPRALLSVKREPTPDKAEREARAAAHAAAAAGQPVDPGAVPADAEASMPDGPDYFRVNPRVTARQAGFVDTIAFRIAFTGPTAALRLFLNKLASFELPVLVREVEVETASAEDATVEDAVGATNDAAAEENPAASIVLAAVPASPKAAPKAAPARPAARPSNVAPIVAKPFSKFTVTVEFVELVTAPPPPAEAAPAAPPPS
ncbi:MAG: Amuc_1100 family pilus-like protein [Opitutaceae bacterium]|nr:Amuc_1100 family pilus-like protein [Opitutaceae bacterium]